MDPDSTAPTPAASAPAEPSAVHYEDVMTMPRRLQQTLDKNDRLTSDQARLLRLLAHAAEAKLPQTQLRTETGFEKHKLSALIGQLRGRRLVKLGIDEQDSRKHTIKIKERGRELLRKLDASANAQLAQLPTAERTETPSDVAAELPAPPAR